MAYDFPIDDALCFINGNPLVLFDIGVGHRPHCEALQFVHRFPGIDVLGLEPNLDVFFDRAKDFPGTLYPWGVWSGPGPQRFFPTADQGNSSLLMKRDEHRLTLTTPTWICCVTIDQLDEMLSQPDKVFLWMDIEGAELEALRGGRRLLESGRLHWIDIEVSDVPRRLQEPTETELDDFLLGFGFEKRGQYGPRGKCHNNVYQLSQKCA